MTKLQYHGIQQYNTFVSQYQPKPKDIGHVENKVPINIFNLHLVYQMDGDIFLWLGMGGM